MHNTNVKTTSRFARKVESLRFNWTRRRYIWRASFFYYFVSYVLLIGIIVTLLFYFFITRFRFFVNYSCSERSISMINIYMLAIAICTGILVILSIFLAKGCNVFSNYTMGHFMNMGKWLNYLGFIVKWVPWLSAVIMWIWLAIQFSGLIWVFVNPKQWCENRYDEMAVNAVKNCRDIARKNTPCQIVLENSGPKESRNCNNPDYLIRRKMVMLALKEPGSSCSIQDISICNAFRDAIEKEDYKWDHEDFPGCHGTVPSDMREFIDEKNTSDLYKYILLFNISWSVLLVIIVCLFYFIKSVTKFDAMIYQPKDPADNIVVKIIRPFTPWTK